LPEELIFEKAIKAEENNERQRASEAIETEIQALKQKAKEEKDKSRFEPRLAHIDHLKERLQASIAEAKRLDDDDCCERIFIV
jgi:molecular chaperone GrpE (heat shock protein)